MNNKINQLQQIKRTLQFKRRRLNKNINELALKHDIADKKLKIADMMIENLTFENENDYDSYELISSIINNSFIEKAEYKGLLIEQAKENQKTINDLVNIRKIENKLPKNKLFERNDINNIIAYIISVIENKESSILHDEIKKDDKYSNFANYFPCLVVGINGKSILVNEDHFPYIVDFLKQIINYLSYKCFEYGYPIETLSYEELYNLANEFLDEYQNTKIKKKVLK